MLSVLDWTGLQVKDFQIGDLDKLLCFVLYSLSALSLFLGR